jgi:chorismate synthase
MPPRSRRRAQADRGAERQADGPPQAIERDRAMTPFRFLTAGESHGRELGVIVEGVPAGLPLASADLGRDLARRQLGYGRGARQSIEHDAAEIVAGVRHGRTLGSPILLRIPNNDAPNWARVMQVEALDDAAAAELAEQAAAGEKRATPVTRVRPGHADLAGAIKYGFDDVRDVLERASARETAARVAAGGVARRFLAELGIDCWSFTAEVGGIAVTAGAATRSRAETEASPLRCPDPAAEALMIDRIDEARSRGDTVGGVFEVVASGVPIGLGSYVHWDRRLDAALAAAVMSINIVKGVEIGLGFEQTRRLGSEVHDVIEGRTDDGAWAHRSNNAGGLTGGVSNGQPIVVRGAVKPISTLARPLPSADLRTGQAVESAHYERSDISVVPAAGVVGEAMVMLTLADFVLEKFGGDSIAETRDNLERYRERISRPVAAAATVTTGTSAIATEGVGSGGDD